MYATLLTLYYSIANALPAVWSCGKTYGEKSEDGTLQEQCRMWMLDEDVAKAKDWLAEHGPETPDLDDIREIESERERATAPKTPVRLPNHINPFTLAKPTHKRPLSRETSDEWVEISGLDNGEGRAPREEGSRAEVAIDVDAWSSSQDGQEDSDPPAKRARFSPTTPVPGAPRKKKTHVTFATTPTSEAKKAVRNLAGDFEAAKRGEAKEVPEIQYPANSLPTPQTGSRVADFEIYEDKPEQPIRHLSAEYLTSTQPIAHLSSPINLDPVDYESTYRYSTPTRKSRHRGASSTKPNGEVNGKGKGRATSETRESSASDVMKAVMAILHQDRHSLKSSTRCMIEHEIEGVLDARESKIRNCERTIAQLREELRFFEDAIM